MLPPTIAKTVSSYDVIHQRYDSFLFADIPFGGKPKLSTWF
jgi:hypothetical protein